MERFILGYVTDGSLETVTAEDAARLEQLLREGREAKERIDASNPDQPSG